MRFATRLFLTVLLALAPALAQTPAKFRLWLAGQEAGGATVLTAPAAGGAARHEAREWLKISRGAATVAQEAQVTVLRGGDGALAWTWSLKVAQEPLEGQASWSPARPGTLRLEPKGGAPKEVPVPAGALLWPGDLEARLKDAARGRTAFKATSFNPQTEGWNTQDLACAGPAPLPGWPDAVRFTGTVVEGPTRMEVETWVSPKDGELKQQGSLMGLPFLNQRAELPAPGAAPAQAGLFERANRRLPAHPLMLWVPEVTVRWTGEGTPEVPEDPQQARLPGNRLRLRKAAAPTAEEAAQAPVQGRPGPEDAPFLAASPLVNFNDPAFEGPLFRLGAPAGAGRWDLAKRVSAFVYDWITEKDYTVGFASAGEVCRSPRGDCTEHGVLAVALLRRLGVPARGVMGWVALGDTLALHFWVEVKLGARWLPIDPTFDQVPASAFRVKLGTTDLESLASVGWDGAAQVFGKGGWTPELEGDLPWGRGLYTQGDQAGGPALGRLDFPGGAWSLDRGRLFFAAYGTHCPVEAAPRPDPERLKDATRIRAVRGPGSGWYLASAKRLWVDLGSGWVTVDRIREAEAVKVVEFLRHLGPAR